MPKPFPFLSSAFLGLALLGSLGCVDKPASGDTSGTSLYLYDNASQSVKVWNDVGALHAAATPATAAATPAPDRVLSGTLVSVNPLAWGGLAVDKSSNKLYLVAAKGGLVTRVERVSTQNSASQDLRRPNDVVTFTLGSSSDRFNGGSFGQACVTSGTGILYVTETSSDQTSSRIWMVPNAASIGDGSVVSPTYVFNADSDTDKGFGGVAAGQSGVIYGFFAGGNSVSDSTPSHSTQTGARIRAGKGAFTNVILGQGTQLTGASTTYGSLAFSSTENELYVNRQASDASLPAVLVFTNQQLLGFTLNPAPSRALGESSAQLPNLRFLAHAGTKDWLAGADMLSTGLGSNILHLWKTPSAGGTSVAVSLDSTVQVGGMALVGSN